MLIKDMFLDLGYGYKVALKEVYAVIPMDTISAKALFRRYSRDKKVIRATKGRKAHSYLLLNNGMVFASCLTSEEIVERTWEMKRMMRALENAEV